MARYKAAAKLFIENKLINAGQEFESDDIPGKKWIPLDAPAEVRSSEPRPSRASVAADKAALKRGAKAGKKKASPGKSVAQQQTDGEEPTVGAIHDNED